jgi:hypothetical protein
LEEEPRAKGKELRGKSQEQGAVESKELRAWSKANFGLRISNFGFTKRKELRAWSNANFGFRIADCGFSERKELRAKRKADCEMILANKMGASSMEPRMLVQETAR